MDKKSWEKKIFQENSFFCFSCVKQIDVVASGKHFVQNILAGETVRSFSGDFFFFHVWNRIKKIINFLGHFCFLIDMFNFFCLPYAPCGTRLSSRSLKTQIFKILKADFWVSIPTRQTLGQPGKSFLGKKNTCVHQSEFSSMWIQIWWQLPLEQIWTN